MNKMENEGRPARQKRINIKALHLSDNDKTNEIIDNDYFLNFSIQVYSSENYEEVKNKYKYLLKNNNNNNFENTLNSDDFYIVNFNNVLGNDYILLYKNFDSRSDALEYCLEYFNISPNCLIINVKNLE